MLNKEEAVKRRREIDRKRYLAEGEFHKAVAELEKEYSLLHSECPHDTMDGTSYTRWCNDCGQTWG
jgi:hypothetical protein